MHASAIAQVDSGLGHAAEGYTSSTEVLIPKDFLTPANLDRDGDFDWYRNNIPFFDCPDEDGGNKIRQVYYYRWRVLKSHLRLTENGYTFSEFIKGDSWRENDMYLKNTYSAINAAAGHVINESKWLRDSRYVEDYINFFLEGNGRLLEYSDWIGAAAYAYYLVSGNTAFITSKLYPLINLWNIRYKKYFDPDIGLFWLTPQEDAMENNSTAYKYNNNFEKTYRPSTNSYAYALAKTIEKIAALSGDTIIAKKFSTKAMDIKSHILKSLWSADDHFFIEKVKRDGSNAPASELIGFAPWYFNIPDDNATYITAWNKLNDPANGFKGDYGMRSIEKSSSYYFYDYKPNTCQWNGPSWPFASSFTLTAMANVLHNYEHKGEVTKKNYYDELKKYAFQQYKRGSPYVAESFHPDKNQWICDINERSEHYLHSTYIDLIISGLIGLRLHAGNELFVSPQIPDTWDHFCIEDVPYKNRQITVVYDVRSDGNRYKLKQKEEVRSGLSVFVDGVLSAYSKRITRVKVQVTPHFKTQPEHKVNFASSVYSFEGYDNAYPKVTASYLKEQINPTTKENIYLAIDNKVFYDTKPNNHFTFWGSPSQQDYIIIDFGEAKRINQINLYLFEDSGKVKAPESYHIKYSTSKDPDNFKDPEGVAKTPLLPVGNKMNKAVFEWVDARKVKIIFSHNGKSRTGIANIHALGYKYPTYFPQTKDRWGNALFNHIDINKTGYYTLKIKYVNGSGSTSDQKLLVNDIEFRVSLPATKGWDVVESVSLNIPLNKGFNSVKFINQQSGKAGINNICIMEMTSFSDDFVNNRPVTDARGWIPWLGIWSVHEGRYVPDKRKESVSLLSYRFNGNFTNYTNVTLTSNIQFEESSGGAGLIFRALAPAGNAGALNGYYAGIDIENKRLVLIKLDGDKTKLLSSSPIALTAHLDYRLTVETENDLIRIFLNNASEPQIKVFDSSFKEGLAGLRALNAGAAFSSITIAERYQD